MSTGNDAKQATENRATQRYNLKSISAVFLGQPCEIIDVSPTGILLRCDGTDDLERGDVITINLSVPLMSHIVPVNVDGFVISNTERGLAFDYAKPSQTWKHVLRVLDDKENRAG
jgi:hypothetical protein